MLSIWLIPLCLNLLLVKKQLTKSHANKDPRSLIITLINFVKDRPGHDFRYAINAEKIKMELNWVPKESFDSGIRKTIHWYLDNHSWWQSIQNKTYRQERLGVIQP